MIENGAPCPCGTGRRYAECCGRFHHGAVPQRADELMRSRYSAYVLGLEPYLLDTWHPRTRPASLHLAEQQGVKWLGLDVKRHEQSDDAHAVVEFVARFRNGGGRAQRMHEVSRFVREDGRWFYVDADETASP